MMKIGASALLFSILSISAFAQNPKLKSIQEGSIWAPQKIKVDARLNDWGDTFQAYNTNTDIYYNLANDENNLYLAIKSSDRMTTSKIMGGGIDFAVNITGKKKDKDAFVIGFPYIDVANLRNMMMNMRPQMGPGRPNPKGQPQGGMDSATVAAMRKQALANIKEIKLIGFKDIQDSLISIYNEYGIKAAADLDSQGNMVVEMAIPLKYFHLNPASEFAYNIKLNGIDLNGIFKSGGRGGGDNVAIVRSNGPGGGPGGRFGGGGFGGGGMPAAISNLVSPTDFWGKYLLAKKQ